eukprot:TRINITY_DN1179_c0_g1_i11.p2 TRINITY_DN1179_c0_g1~~TRINITY_DN1179_c0_g1_i11.p2  ORF type:complete len:157 (+),score=28.67 TRINITY_DN1179_c0_g1_i11:334-804(+)
MRNAGTLMLEVGELLLLVLEEVAEDDDSELSEGTLSVLNGLVGKCGLAATLIFCDQKFRGVHRLAGFLAKNHEDFTVEDLLRLQLPKKALDFLKEELKEEEAKSTKVSKPAQGPVRKRGRYDHPRRQSDHHDRGRMTPHHAQRGPKVRHHGPRFSN